MLGVIGCVGNPGRAGGDEVVLDERLLDTHDATSFRSEFRVGTSFQKYVILGSEHGGGGSRVGSTATTMGLGPEGVSISSLFDDDGLQPPHLRVAMEGKTFIEQTEQMGDRCASNQLVYKAVPDGLPSFQLPNDIAGQVRCAVCWRGFANDDPGTDA